MPVARQRLSSIIIAFPFQLRDLLSNVRLPGLGRFEPRKIVAVADEEVP